MNHLAFIIQVAPLQAECFADAKPGHGYKEDQCPVRFSQFHHDAECVLRADDDGFVVGLGGLRVAAKNQPSKLVDGTISNSLKVAPEIKNKYWKAGVRADILGYMDRGGRFRYCRQTAWTAENPEVIAAAKPMILAADRIFKNLMPERHTPQLYHADDAPDFSLWNTAFTTTTTVTGVFASGRPKAGKRAI